MVLNQCFLTALIDFCGQTLPSYVFNSVVNTQLYVVANDGTLSFITVIVCCTLYYFVSSSSLHLTMEMPKVPCSRNVCDSCICSQAHSLENWPEV